MGAVRSVEGCDELSGETGRTALDTAPGSIGGAPVVVIDVGIGEDIEPWTPVIPPV